MSDQVERPVNDANKKSRQTLQQHQSVWLAHWNRTSCVVEGETIGPNSSGDEELEYVTRNGNDLTEGLEGSSRSVKGLEMIKARTSEIGYGIIKVSSKSVGNERMLGSLSKGGQETENIRHEDKGKAALSAVSKQPRTAKRLLECEECYKDRHSAGLTFERKMDCHSQPENSVKACFKQSITSDQYLSTYGFKRSAKMQKSPVARLFPSQCISSEKSETKKSHNDSCYLLKLKNNVDGVETMRICATVDASEGMPEGCSTFSQTNNGLLITKKTDGSAFKGNDMVRNKRLIANTKGNISNKFHCLWPLSGHGKQQVILQPLNSLTNCEVKENIGDVKGFKAVIRNESSAQTDTMNMDCSEENSKKDTQSGSNSTASNKAFNLESNIPAWSIVASSREVLPHINSQVPALPRAASFSKTLETEKLVEQAKPKSNFNLNDLPNANPGDRWVKRLKLSSPNNSAQGTKSSNYASSSSCQVKISKLFGGIPKCSTIRSTPALEKSVVLGKIEKGKEASVLSDGWIKRWLYIERKTKCETKPQSSKLSLQLPSIAAMALMGKALAYLQPCEFRKRGSCTVWNIEAF